MTLSELIEILQEVRRKEGDRPLSFWSEFSGVLVRAEVKAVVNPASGELHLQLGPQATRPEKNEKVPEDVKFLSQVLMLAFLEGQKSKGPADNSKGLQETELHLLQADWPRYSELAAFYLEQLRALHQK